jgi:hypothetical protein
MNKERKYILIDCYHAYYEVGYEYCKILKKYGHYFSLNITTNEKQFDVKSVTKEEFEEAIK